MTPEKININVGVLGHVDSGKTSLCKVLSTTGSTAAFDQNPQSKERGITLDLGFSSLSLEATEKKYNFTLVDCPGHSSLIRTVIGGAQIMDIMLLIIDINKGMQPQAAECLILAQITSSHLIVVLNKVDLIPVDSRQAKIQKMKKLMRGALSKTKFGEEPIVCVSAADSSIGTGELKEALLEKVAKNEFSRQVDLPFLMAVDHCFSIKGQGTIVTGTVIQGVVKINDVIEFPSLRDTKKVKSMQSFRVPVNEARAGDRIGMCVPGLDSSTVERTLVAAPGAVLPGVRAGVISVDKIPYFKKPIESKKKYHVSVGYDTVTARVILFQAPTKDVQNFNPALDYEHVEEIGPSKTDKSENKGSSKDGKVYAVLEFDRPVMAMQNSLLIGSDLQSEDENACRLAFSGQLLECTQDKQYLTNFLPSVKIFKEKMKEGALDRIVSESQLIAKGFCKKESNIDHLIGLKVKVILPEPSAMNVEARIESRFGQTNKVRLNVMEPMTADVVKELKNNVKQVKVVLNFKKYFYGSAGKSKLVQ